MVAMATDRLTALAAWPTATLHRPGGELAGFAMPKLAGHRPVFQVYGPKLRLRQFPRADWRFPGPHRRQRGPRLRGGARGRPGGGRREPEQPVRVHRCDGPLHRHRQHAGEPGRAHLALRRGRQHPSAARDAGAGQLPRRDPHAEPRCVRAGGDHLPVAVHGAAPLRRAVFRPRRATGHRRGDRRIPLRVQRRVWADPDVTAPRQPADVGLAGRCAGPVRSRVLTVRHPRRQACGRPVDDGAGIARCVAGEMPGECGALVCARRRIVSVVRDRGPQRRRPVPRDFRRRPARRRDRSVVAGNPGRAGPGPTATAATPARRVGRTVSEGAGSPATLAQRQATGRNRLARRRPGRLGRHPRRGPCAAADRRARARRRVLVGATPAGAGRSAR